jgi:hypothetical protein
VSDETWAENLYLIANPDKLTHLARHRGAGGRPAGKSAC